MNYFADIGNSHLRIYNQQGEEILKCTSVKFSLSMLKELGFNKADRIFASCVVREIQNEWEVQIKEQVQFLKASDFDFLDFSSVEQSSFGADRIANLAGLHLRALAPAVVFDCGTCITAEILLANGKVAGGAIFPGRQLQAKALKLETSQLPEISLSETANSGVGTNTQEAIQAGIERGLIGAIRELYNKYCESCGELQLVFTGGDADFFAREFNPSLNEKNLLLLSLNHILNEYNQN